jgi:hypothetical protein
LLSNNVINDFISFSFDFKDEEIVDYYISFLKSLALKIPKIPIDFFLNEVPQKNYKVIYDGFFEEIPKFPIINSGSEVFQP